MPRIVLDTNVLLDWLVFGNPIAAVLSAAIGEGRVCWVASRAMHDEMAHVLQRGLGGRWTAVDTRWREAWAQHVAWLPEAVRPGSPRCSDPDDQKFIDLALAEGARWLLTRDRAVLKLARGLRRYGVEVLTPERWVASVPGLVIDGG